MSSDTLEDPVLIDTWNLVPRDMRDYIRTTFGQDGFMVRKDMMNNALGYREASVGDLWTGMSRLHPTAQKAFVDTASLIMGDKAFRNLVTAEKAIQAGVSVAKNTIVIRSVIVPLSNMASNFRQLLLLGVNARSIYSGMKTKLVEIDQHLKNLDRKVELEVQLARYRSDPIKTLKINVELKSLEDSSRRMSIWPLIEAGEFTTISEGLTEADAAISQGSWAEYMQNLIDKHVPEKLGTVGRCSDHS